MTMTASLLWPRRHHVDWHTGTTDARYPSIAWFPLSLVHVDVIARQLNAIIFFSQDGSIWFFLSRRGGSNIHTRTYAAQFNDKYISSSMKKIPT
jgi:hypothetical protein